MGSDLSELGWLPGTCSLVQVEVHVHVQIQVQEQIQIQVQMYICAAVQLHIRLDVVLKQLNLHHGRESGIPRLL